MAVATHAAFRDKQPSRKDNARLQRNGTVEELSIEVLPLPEQEDNETYFLVLFRKITEYAADKPAVGSEKAKKKQALILIDKRNKELE